MDLIVFRLVVHDRTKGPEVCTVIVRFAATAVLLVVCSVLPILFARERILKEHVQFLCQRR